MKVLVTGGAGYVGSRLVARLLERGDQVRVLDALVHGARALLAFEGWANFELLKGDARRAEDLSTAIAGVDLVVHAAAVVGDVACDSDPEVAWSVNGGALETIMDVLSSREAPRFVFLSTCSNYGVSAPSVIADESSDLNPVSGYARAKVFAEQTVLGTLVDASVTVLRLGTICGNSGRMRFDLLVNEIGRDVALAKEVEIFAPEAWRPYLHIDDAAEAIMHVADAPDELVRDRVFNVVGENLQKSSLVELAHDLDPKAEFNVVCRSPDLRDYRVSGDLLASTTGFRPHRSIARAMREVFLAVRRGYYLDPLSDDYGALPARGIAAALS